MSRKQRKRNRETAPIPVSEYRASSARSAGTEAGRYRKSEIRRQGTAFTSEPPQPAPVRPALLKWQGAVLLLLVGIMALSIPSFVRYDERSRRARCSDNLSQIGRACLNYSIDYRGPAMSLPDFVQAAAAAYLQPEQLLCAECGEVFVYVDRPSRPRGGYHPCDVFAYEPPEYHGGKGGHVLFADGAVRWYTPAAQDELIDATLARQEAATSRPG